VCFRSSSNPFRLSSFASAARASSSAVTPSIDIIRHLGGAIRQGQGTAPPRRTADDRAARALGFAPPAARRPCRVRTRHGRRLHARISKTLLSPVRETGLPEPLHKGGGFGEACYSLQRRRRRADGGAVVRGGVDLRAACGAQAEPKGRGHATSAENSQLPDDPRPFPGLRARIRRRGAPRRTPCARSRRTATPPRSS
jgi:hypothetical protein